jgi:hypothetical protein
MAVWEPMTVVPRTPAGRPAETPTPDVLRTVVELSSRAPSVHNTQPWSWRTSNGGLELVADTSRLLPASDPTGRNLTISCGAALHHAQVVAAALGWSVVVDRLPDGETSSSLARLRFDAGAAVGAADDAAADVLLAVRERCTDRRRFTAWPVPDAELQRFARIAGAWGAHAVPLVDVADRFRVDRLVARASELQARDAEILTEQQTWVDRGHEDGVPSAVLPNPDLSTSASTVTRFGAGLLDDPAVELETSDGVILLCGYTDTRADWLRTGEALSALWLQATLDGLSVVPLSQVVEVAETRHALYQDVLGGLAVPHLLVRMGWQALSRSQLTRTSRRPLDDVLDAS